MPAIPGQRGLRGQLIDNVLRLFRLCVVRRQYAVSTPERRPFT
jgi:hypothetical protein